MASAGSQVSELASKLYDACVNEFSRDHLFYQNDFLNLKVIPKNDVSLLLECTQSLVNQNLFRLLQKDGKLTWKLIDREDAEKLRNLTPDEAMVYNVIHSTERTGIWVRHIGNRTNLHKSILDRCLKSLEGKNYIKSLHNVKYPSRKMYMLAGLAPSEEVTGGAWFTDGVLDATFIGTIATFIEFKVAELSWYKVPAAERKNKRIKTASGKADVKSHEKNYLPYPHGYTGYPNVQVISQQLHESNLTPVHLSDESLIQLLDTLCYDNKIVALNNGEYYRALRNPDEIKAERERKKLEETNPSEENQQIVKNGMTEAPCGSCPVFRLCSPGSAVSPETCEYFDPWLDKALSF
ncbi:RNA polymerase Rpc34 [Penicillium sp. DV-2018c]|nr:RNA polymerase Rpc34 [Penicillium sp. DV-2018c]KAJ5559297.1 RNA polymerase Rpc34 [Penicillium sp. DV-2018c]